MLGFDGGAIGADIYCDRSGIHARTIGDCAKILDALKDPVDGYYDPRDPFTTVPRSSVLNTVYASYAKASGAPGALKGMRLGVIRESMVYPTGSKTEEPIVTAAAREIKDIPLRSSPNRACRSRSCSEPSQARKNCGRRSTRSESRRC
jgi:amidase